MNHKNAIVIELKKKKLQQKKKSLSQLILFLEHVQ